MDWITEQIAVGNFLDAADLPAEIDAVLCLKANCCDEGRLDVAVLSVPLVDGPGNDPRPSRGGSSVHRGRCRRGRADPPYCHAGRFRSVAVVARYLVEYRGMTSHAALALIKDKREIYLSDGIEELLGR
jgi:hypothetical protein